MIVGVGIDIVRTDRMKRWIENPKLLARYFHPAELETVRERGSEAVLSLSARFAAKEAFGKALGTGLRNLTLRNIRVNSAFNGKPSMTVEGDALVALEHSGARVIHISLTHERDVAAAFVLLEA